MYISMVAPRYTKVLVAYDEDKEKIWSKITWSKFYLFLLADPVASLLVQTELPY